MSSEDYDGPAASAEALCGGCRKPPPSSLGKAERGRFWVSGTLVGSGQPRTV